MTKTVAPEATILLYPGDYAEVEYEVVADLADPKFVDSDWAVEGTITIENLRAADVVLASVTDMISPGDIAAPVDCEAWVVPGLGSVTCTYGPVELPDGSVRTNTVTVMVEGSSDEWITTADIRFGEPTDVVDGLADVEDSQLGYLGQVAWDETPATFTYSTEIYAPGDVCGLYEVENTATLVPVDLTEKVEDTATVEILEVCEVTIAYEDLPLDATNDWDYNDLVIHVPIGLEVSEFGDLLAVSFEVTQEPVLSAFSHAFNIQPCAELCTCTGTWIRTVTRDGSTTIETGVYTPGDNLLLVPNSKDPPDLVELRIEFDVEEPGDCPRYCGEPDPVNEYHGEWLFFDPWLTVYPRPLDGIDPYEIHVLRPPDDPASEPRILTVPAAWVPPLEKTPIWEVYLCVGEGNPPQFTAYWWDDDLCTPP